MRQAMNYAINKKAILSSILFDLGTVSVSPCPPMMFGGVPVQEGGWPYNPIKAKQLLAEAGYKDGFEVNFFAADRPLHPGLPVRPGCSQLSSGMSASAPTSARWTGRPTSG